jgi:transposase-like protein
MAIIASEVKNEILDKVKSGIPVAKLAQQYGVSDRSIYAWLKKKAVGTISLLQYNRLKRENQQLKEIIGILALELEKTKKKAGY